MQNENENFFLDIFFVLVFAVVVEKRKVRHAPSRTSHPLSSAIVTCSAIVTVCS